MLYCDYIIGGKISEKFETPFYFYDFRNDFSYYEEIFPELFEHASPKNPEKEIFYKYKHFPENDLLQEDYFLLEGYIIYNYNNSQLDLQKCFLIYLQKFPKNPYMLLRYGRYL